MWYAIVAILILIADQGLKYWVTVNIALDTGHVTLIPGVLELTNIHNNGAAFSMLEHAPHWIFIIFTLVFAAIAVFCLRRNVVHGKVGRWSVVLVLAGAVGNCIDRILSGYVVDMFNFLFVRFAVFNLADVFIVVAGITLCLHVIFYRGDRLRMTPPKEAEAKRPRQTPGAPPGHQAAHLPQSRLRRARSEREARAERRTRCRRAGSRSGEGRSLRSVGPRARRRAAGDTRRARGGSPGSQTGSPGSQTGSPITVNRQRPPRNRRRSLRPRRRIRCLPISTAHPLRPPSRKRPSRTMPRTAVPTAQRTHSTTFWRSFRISNGTTNDSNTGERRADRRSPRALFARAHAQRRPAAARAGRAVTGGAPVKKNYKTVPGDTFVVTLPDAAPSELVAQDLPLDVVYEDADLIVVNKPRGMVVHPAPGHEDGTLVNALLAHCGESLSGVGGERRPGIVHRIDKDTSGLLVAAKNDFAHLALSAQLSGHTMARTYEAVVCGNLRDDAGTVDAPIGRHPTDPSAWRDAKNPAAPSHWSVIARYNGYHAHPLRAGDRPHAPDPRAYNRRIGHLLGDRYCGHKRPEKGERTVPARCVCLRHIRAPGSL